MPGYSGQIASRAPFRLEKSIAYDTRHPPRTSDISVRKFAVVSALPSPAQNRVRWRVNSFCVELGGHRGERRSTVLPHPRQAHAAAVLASAGPLPAQPVGAAASLALASSGNMSQARQLPGIWSTGIPIRFLFTN